MLIGSMMCMDMVSSPYRHTQSRGVRLWCGGEYCSRLAIFLDVETLKHFFSVGRLVARTHARYGVVSTSLTVNVSQSIPKSSSIILYKFDDYTLFAKKKNHLIL